MLNIASNVRASHDSDSVKSQWGEWRSEAAHKSYYVPVALPFPALEGKAKELEERVAELERECETLRRENDWLKGLVVGVTGSVAPPTAPSQQQHTGGTGTKRGRDD